MLVATFFTYFNQTSLQTILIPFTEKMFGWTELENSVLFCVAGSFIIFSFVLIKLLSLKLSDKVILLLGIVVILLGLAIGCTFLSFAKLPEKRFRLIEKSNSRRNATEEFLSIYKEANASSNQTEEYMVYDKTSFAFFLVFVVFDVLGLPLVAITSASLFSKIVSFEAQGFGQGKTTDNYFPL